MSQESMDLVRSIQAAWERGDYTSRPVGTPRYRARDRRRTTLGRWTGSCRDGGCLAAYFLGAWEEYRVEADEYRELDGERVLVLVHRSGRGRASGVELAEMPGQGANLFRIGAAR